MTNIRKLGTFDLDIVEANPVVFQGKPYLMQYIRNRTKGGEEWSTGSESYFQFLDMEDMKTLSQPFGHGFHMGNAFVEDDHILVTAVEGWGRGRFYQLESDDMVHWSPPRVILENPTWEGYNTSVCKAEGRYVMAFELGAPLDMVKVPFTMFFAESTDGRNWSQIPDAVFGEEFYTGAPMLRHNGGFFYFFHLEGSYEEGFTTRVSRSNDLKNWVMGNRPVLEYGQEGRQILPRAAQKFSNEELVKIASAVNINASDLDMCEWDGKLLMCYSWGNQRGTEFLALAQADCSEKEFCECFFL